LAEIEVRGAGSVTVSPSDTIVIQLPENPTTGYQWTSVTIPDLLELTSSEFAPPDRLAPGAGGERVIRVSATRSGNGEVIVRLVRAWQPAAPLEEVRVSVTVR
jgi:inhibitor of cysteine peptidase